MARYSEAFKDAIITRILSTDSPSIRSVAAENDVPIGTVLNWLSKKDIHMKNKESNLKPTKEVIDDSLQDKFKIILETASMSEVEMGAYCRTKGIYTQDVEVWKQEMLTNLDSRNKKKLDKENNDLKVKVRELQSELRCKDKALAETAALLLLKKKARIIWEVDEEER